MSETKRNPRLQLLCRGMRFCTLDMPIGCLSRGFAELPWGLKAWKKEGERDELIAHHSALASLAFCKLVIDSGTCYCKRLRLPSVLCTHYRTIGSRTLYSVQVTTERLKDTI